MEKMAQVKWGRGKFSDVFRSTIIDPSPIKAGQKVKVLWGEIRKEYAAVVDCYPEAKPMFQNPQRKTWSCTV